MRDVLSLVLGGGRGTRLYPLTKLRSEPAVPIAGKYRLIDIPLSNCINSGFNRVYVLTQFLSVSLHRHIANTYKFAPFSQGFVTILAAQQTNEAADWYRGTAHALRQNLLYLKQDSASEVLVLCGDQLYRMDFRQLVKTHQKSRADVTLAVLPVRRDQASDLGVVRVDERHRITDLVEKPRAEQLEPLRVSGDWLRQHGLGGGHAKEPDAEARETPLAAPHRGEGREYLANMGIYLFRRQALLELLEAQPLATDIVTELCCRSLGTHRVQAYLFDGYWEDVGSIKTYYEASLALAGDDPPFDFHSTEGVIYTRMRNLPAARVNSARLEDCLVSDGCTILPGARLSRCVVGIRTRVGRDAILREAVLCGADHTETDADRELNRRRGLPDLGVGDGAVVERAILDKDCRIGRGARVVNARGVANEEGDNYVIRDGIVVIPKGAVVADGAVI